jgi:hypothetical protein
MSIQVTERQRRDRQSQRISLEDGIAYFGVCQRSAIAIDTRTVVVPAPQGIKLVRRKTSPRLLLQHAMTWRDKTE